MLTPRGVLQFELPQRVQRLAGERQRALLVVLRLADEGPPLFQIDIRPLETDQLALSRARRDGEENEGVERRPFGLGTSIQQRAPLLIGQEPRASARLLLPADIAHGVAIEEPALLH